MERIVFDIVRLIKEGIEVVLVTSGAVGAGKSIVTLRDTTDEIARKQVFASVGQAALIGEYRALFQKHNVTPAQILVTKEDFRDSDHRDNMERCFEALLHEGLLPIVNENDTTAITELMFTDNDELTALVALLIHASQVVILTSVGGVLDQSGSLIPHINSSSIEHIIQAISDTASQGGRGGMKSKLIAAQQLLAAHIPVVIASAQEPYVIYTAAHHKAVGTLISQTKEGL